MGLKALKTIMTKAVPIILCVGEFIVSNKIQEAAIKKAVEEEMEKQNKEKR